MATYHELPRPPAFRGTEQEKWKQLRDYLLKVTEQLQNIINTMSEEGEKKDGN